MTLLSLLLAAGLVGSWVAAVLVGHAQPAGTTIEVLLVGPLVAPAVLHRLLAWRGRVPAPGALLGAVDLLAALAPWTERPAWTVAFALTSALLRAAPGRPAPGAAPLAGRLLAWPGAAAALASLALAAAWGRPLALERCLLVGPALVELLVGPERGARAALRRVAVAAVLACSGWWRYEHLLAVAAPALLSGAALVAWTGDPLAWRRRARRALAAGLGAVVAVGLLELVVRAGLLGRADVPRTPPVDQGPGYHKPGAAWVFHGAAMQERPAEEVVVRWNRRGWHDVDHDDAKPPGALRVLVLGDSFVEGAPIPLERLYHRELERQLAAGAPDLRVEAVAIAWAGWGQRQMAERLVREGLGYDPDLVIVEFFGENDVFNNSVELEGLVDRQLHGRTFLMLQADALRKGLEGLASALHRLDGLAPRAPEVWSGVHRLRPDHPELWEEAWRRTEGYVASMQDLLRARGVPLVFVNFNDPPEVAALAARLPDDADPNPRRPALRMGALCQARGVPWVDLTPAFAAVEPAEARALLHIPGDRHWSPAGHELGARTTAKALLAAGSRPWAEARAHAARAR